jgi:predicted lipid-binding transport protein (Tim44 family)
MLIFLLVILLTITGGGLIAEMLIFLLVILLTITGGSLIDDMLIFLLIILLTITGEQDEPLFAMVNNQYITNNKMNNWF